MVEFFFTVMAYLALRRLVVDEATVDGEEVRQDGHTGDEVLVYERLVLQLLVLCCGEGRRPRRPPHATHRVLLVVVLLLLCRQPRPPYKWKSKARRIICLHTLRA